MANYTDITHRWLDVAFGRTDKPNFSSSNRVWANGDSIYSYGTHFEMARIQRDANGEPSWFLVNGDRYSPTTSGHQSIVRNVLSHERLRSIIIPYTALQAASIDFTTIEPIDEEPERWETTNHESDTIPPGARWSLEDIWESVDLTQAELDAEVAERNAKAVEEWERKREWAKTDTFWAEHISDEPPVLDESCISEWHRRELRVTGQRKVLRFSRGSVGREIDVIEQDDGSFTYEWTTTRHWLGESLIRTRVRWGGYTPCKPCRGTGTHPDLQGPPEPDGSWEWDKSYEEREWVPQPGRRNAWTSDWSERELTFCPKCNGRGGKNYTRSRLSYFLSGFDSQESRPLYFFCELPKDVEPTSIAEAYEALKPRAVKLAEDMGRDIIRQGDIFAIPLQNLDKRALRKKGARFEKRGNLLGTNHEASEVAYMPDGTTLVRGLLYHNPEWRQPDHARRKLTPKVWHVVQKNTVPVAA